MADRGSKFCVPAVGSLDSTDDEPLAYHPGRQNFVAPLTDCQPGKIFNCDERLGVEKVSPALIP
jgi:hypothetical protein